jgi:ABC-type sugar transport system ATPase subunit
VLEEPTRGVDVGTKAEIYHLLGELARQGKAVLVITSDIEEATLVSERVLVMRSGRIACELTSPDQEELALAAHGLTEELGV